MIFLYLLKLDKLAMISSWTLRQFEALSRSLPWSFWPSYGAPFESVKGQNNFSRSRSLSSPSPQSSSSEVPKKRILENSFYKLFLIIEIRCLKPKYGNGFLHWRHQYWNPFSYFGVRHLNSKDINIQCILVIAKYKLVVFIILWHMKITFTKYTP